MIANQLTKEYLLAKYAEVKEALKESERKYDANRRSVKKRETFQWIASRYHLMEDILYDLGIEFDDLEN